MTLTCSLLAFMVATCCQASVRGSYRSMLVAPCKQESYSKNKNKHHKCNVDKKTVNLILQLRKEFIVDAYLARVHAPHSIQVSHSCFAGTSASRLKQRPGNGSCEMNINSQVTCIITSSPPLRQQMVLHGLQNQVVTLRVSRQHSLVLCRYFIFYSHFLVSK